MSTWTDIGGHLWVLEESTPGVFGAYAAVCAMEAGKLPSVTTSRVLAQSEIDALAKNVAKFYASGGLRFDREA